jgi:hypothetical protein
VDVALQTRQVGQLPLRGGKYVNQTFVFSVAMLGKGLQRAQEPRSFSSGSATLLNRGTLPSCVDDNGPGLVSLLGRNTRNPYR